MATTTTIDRRLRIHGLVQGVGYRWSMVQAARRLAVSGWVRNRADGTVEAHARGPAGAVQALIDWAREGPPQARVIRLEVQAQPDDGPTPTAFEQRGTA